MITYDFGFNSALAKERNPIAQNTLRKFYQYKWPNFEARKASYSCPLGATLEVAGIDKVLTKLNAFGNVSEQILIQEKIRPDLMLSRYEDVILEVGRSNGRPGWAIDPKQKSDLLVIYYSDVILILDTLELRNWLTPLQEELKEKYILLTDNTNLKIPLSLLEKHIRVEKYHTKFYR